MGFEVMEPPNYQARFREKLRFYGTKLIFLIIFDGGEALKPEQKISGKGKETKNF